MGKYWRCGLAAAAVALCAQGAWAQKMTGCPEGQAMQSSDPSGKSVTCVPIPDTAGLQQQIANEATARQAQDANILNMLGAEAAARGAADGALQGNINNEAGARAAADAALGERINTLSNRVDALSEADIVGKWATTGTTVCQSSSRGFDANMSPLIVTQPGVPPAPPTTLPTIVTQLTATSLGTRTFNANNTGTAEGTTLAINQAGVVVGVIGTDGAGGATGSSFTNTFDWHIQPDGKLFIDDAGPLVQTAFLPPTRVGWTFTIDKTPAWHGFISKDKKTIVMTHNTLQIETSTTLDQNGVPPPGSAPSVRFCIRHRVLTRLPN
jgi:hypothetical protein